MEPEPKKFRRALIGLFFVSTFLSGNMSVIAAPTVQHIEPFQTDPKITTQNVPHTVVTQGGNGDEPLFIWITGTGGTPEGWAWPMLNTALGEGYRAIAISYINTPAVAQICRDQNLERDPDCPAHFRQKRSFGDNVTPLISDQKQDAIVHRLTALLEYLVKNDPQGHWDAYLEQGEPKWSKLVLAGQSQGGGMAAFIAKQKHVAGVMDFSGGWDFSAPDKIANWYSRKSATPPDVWYGTYGANEQDAKIIAESYAAMNIPVSHRFALDRPTKLDPHGAGSADPVYKDIWVQMLQHK